MAHLKRHASPKSWPIRRKGTKYVIKTSSKGVSVLLILREMLKLAHDRREAKRIIHDKKIMLNEKLVNDEKKNANLFDTITIIPLKKHYRVELSKKGKFELVEIKENESKEKVAKVIGKKKLRQGKIQLNLGDGGNFFSDIKCNTNDSVLINFKNRKIEKCIPLKEKARAFVFEGKHVGKQGIIEKIITKQKMAEIESNGEKINVLIKQFIIIQ